MTVLRIPLVCPTLNNWYAGTHWRKRKEVADLWHTTIWYCYKNQWVEPVTRFPVIITTQTWYKPTGRHRDTSNCFPANKLAEDGLVKVGILPDDTTEYVAEHRTLTPVIVKTEKENETVITITEDI